MIEIKRVKIYPANKEQMENQIVAEKDPELKKAYKEMLQGCIDHPDLWNWYATEAASLAIKWAFNHPEVKAVEAETDINNAASQKVLEKCGFKATGTMGEEGPRYILYREEV